MTAKRKKPEIKEMSESHLELRTKTEITRDYSLTLVTLVQVKTSMVHGTIEQIREEEEIYRIGFEDISKATEVHKQIADVIEHLRFHKLLAIPSWDRR
jgi:hypothetical protein